MKKVSRRELARTITRQLLSGADQAPLMRQVAAYLVEHKMVNQLDMLLSDIAVQLQASTGHVTAEATTAFPLTAELQTAVQQQVQALTGAKSVELKTTVDQDLLGGVIVRTAGRELDASVRRKLTSLSRGGA